MLQLVLALATLAALAILVPLFARSLSRQERLRAAVLEEELLNQLEQEPIEDNRTYVGKAYTVEVKRG